MLSNRVPSLNSIAASMRSTEAPPIFQRDRERVSLELNCFCVSLLFNGRPGKEKHVTLVHGRGMNDIIDQGATIKLAPWHYTKDNPFPQLQIFEVQGGDLSGWWAEIEPNVMAYLPFAGRTGLDANDVACLISESQFPPKALVAWCEDRLKESNFSSEDVIASLPMDLLDCVGPSFACGKRKLSMANDRGLDTRPLFSVHEIDRELSRSVA